MEPIKNTKFYSVSELKTGISVLESDCPQIYYLSAANRTSKELIVISPGLGTRHLHLSEPFIGYQLSRIGYNVAVINTLDLANYGLDKCDPFVRVALIKKAYERLREVFPEQKFIGLGHSLGCIDLLRAKPENLEACVFLSPGFKGDKKKFALNNYLQFLWSFALKRELKLYPHGYRQRPELNSFKTDWIDARFLWNLQKYAHGLQRTHLWPLDVPVYAWLGAEGESDGVMTTKEPLVWIENMKQLNPNFKFTLSRDAGHEPGWRNPEHAKELASELHHWLQSQYSLKH